METMKTQSPFNVVVTENVNIRLSDTGPIERIEKKILFTGIVTAYDDKNAELQGIVKAFVANPKMNTQEVNAVTRLF